jgi:hypothetical protein
MESGDPTLSAEGEEMADYEEDVPEGEEVVTETDEVAAPLDICKDHVGLDVPLEEVGTAKDKLRRYEKNASKFDERGFRIIRKETPLVAGFDLLSDDEKAKRAARAAKWGVPAIDEAGVDALADDGDDDAAPAESPEEDMSTLEERQKRAERFGVVLKDDEKVEAAEQAKVEALLGTSISKILTSMPKRRKSLLKLDEQDRRVDPDPATEVRPDALHLYGYMPLGTDDFLEFYRPYGVQTVEWINGASLNVVFADAFSAQRAFSLTSEPLPELPPKAAVEEGEAAMMDEEAGEGGAATDAAAAAPEEGGEGEGGDSTAAMEDEEAAEATTEGGDGSAEASSAVVDESDLEVDLASFGWRLCADITKHRSDKYGKKGEVGNLLVRFATVDDLKIFKPRPERSERPGGGKRGQRKRRSRDADDMDLDGGAELDEHGAKVHSLVIRQPPKRAKRTKKNKEHQLVIRASDNDDAEDGEQQGDRGGSPATEGSRGRGRVSFNPDGSISLRRGGGGAAVEGEGEGDAASAEMAAEEEEEGGGGLAAEAIIEDGMDEEEEV